MEKVNEVFFSEKGVTSTSASHLADLAQETILGNEAKLKNMSFITTKVDIVGSLSESGKTVSLGYDEKSLSEVKGLLEEIAEMNAFCAWMREAIKAKEREIQHLMNGVSHSDILLLKRQNFRNKYVRKTLLLK